MAEFFFHSFGNAIVKADNFVAFGFFVEDLNLKLRQFLSPVRFKCLITIGKVEITDLNTRKAEGGNGYLAELNKQEPTEQTPSKQIEQNKPAVISPQTDDISDMTFWFILAGVFPYRWVFIM